MKSLGAALVVLAGVAGSATAQISPPTPAPVATFPLTVPQTIPPLRLGPPEAVAAPPYENMPALQLPIPDIRVPTSYGALYSAPYTATGYIDPAALRRGGALENRATCCDSGLVCQPAGQFWGEFDYILWKTSGDNVPALVTSSPTGTAAAQAGVLGTPGARILSGGSSFSDGGRSGLRYNVGVWLNSGQSFGLQTGGFFLEDGSTHSAFASGGDPILAHPFINAVTKAPSSQLVAFPGAAGGIAVDHFNSVDGFDVALRGNMCCASSWRLDALFGYRYLRIEDGLAINENLTTVPGAPASLTVPAGLNILVADRFHTSNTFNGMEVGIAGEYRFADRWFVSGVGKASLGWIDQVSDIAGGTTILVPGLAPTRNAGGLLALSSNIGHHAQSNAVIIPELNLNVGYQLSPNLRVRAGYNFLYVSSVARPGTIIDTTVNPALIPPPTGTLTPARPVGQSERTDFILHGINAGIELRF